MCTSNCVLFREVLIWGVLVEMGLPAVDQEGTSCGVMEGEKSSEEGEQRPCLFRTLVVQPASEVHVLHCACVAVISYCTTRRLQGKNKETQSSLTVGFLCSFLKPQHTA